MSVETGKGWIGACKPAVSARLEYAFRGVFKNMAVLLLNPAERPLHVILGRLALPILDDGTGFVKIQDSKSRGTSRGFSRHQKVKA